MKNKMPVKRNKKYIKKEFTVTREEARPARPLGKKILRIIFFVLLTALMALTIAFKLRHYFVKHW
ncbi:hypothetical protein WG904_02110 [Pedobacter sp. Du54]|uniref:hypothetical protein n=1 Tax=Pedobacter anseongensis TaxID=3133439 RepID=UPI003096BE36